MIGQKISHYRIVKKIGEGGMGVVYLAEDQHLQRNCALKFLAQSSDYNAELKRRFKREAQAIAALNHPNIVTIYELGEFNDTPYIIMEYVEGSSLREILKQSKLSLEKSLDYIQQMCQGLSVAHFAGIIHRDLKPENILIDKNKNLKILDFGLAKLMGSSSITKESSRVGTIHYMSPEQVHGYELDARSDIFSLGVIFYEMVTGKTPFKGEYDVAVMYSILNEQPPPLDKTTIPNAQALQKIIDKAISKDMHSRYHTAEEFLDDLIEYNRKNSEATKPADDTTLLIEQHSIQDLLSHREKIDALIEKEYKKDIVIMFCDIVGSTQFFEQRGDIEGRAMVQRFTGMAFPVINSSQGKVIKTMGDGILASFDDPVQACICAKKLQNTLKQENVHRADEDKITARVAMHYGKAVIDSNDVYGDVVNVAARVEGHTKGNQIMISEPLFNQISGESQFECHNAGAFSLKGKSGTMNLYRLRWYDGEEISVPEKQRSISDVPVEEIVIKKKYETPQPQITSSKIEKSSKNPYMNRVMIRDSEEFFGRKNEISKIFSRLGSARPQSVSVVGERRIGKSSLLNFIYNPVNRRQYLANPDDYIFIFVDFQEKRGIDIAEFFATIYRCLIKEFNEQLEINLKPGYEGFIKLIQFFDKKELKLIMVFDEFELITKNKNFDTEFYSFARSMANNYNVAYLVSSGRNLQTMCHSKEVSDSPFFNIFSSLTLSQFNRQEATELITIPSKRAGFPLEAHVDYILDIAGYYPFFIQMACASLYEFIKEYGRLSKTHFSKANEEFLDEAQIHFQQIWDICEEEQRYILLTLAGNKPLSPQKEYLVPVLEKSGYIKIENSKPAIFSSLFGQFILERFGEKKHSKKKKFSIWPF